MRAATLKLVLMGAPFIAHFTNAAITPADTYHIFQLADSNSDQQLSAEELWNYIKDNQGQDSLLANVCSCDWCPTGPTGETGAPESTTHAPETLAPLGFLTRSPLATYTGTPTEKGGYNVEPTDSPKTQPTAGPQPCRVWDCVTGARPECVRPNCYSESPTAPTEYPTGSPTASPMIHMGGDPFTAFRGKQTQFYLPLGSLQSLITCENVQLSGEAFGSELPNDTQQWFRAFSVAVNGKEMVNIEVRDASKLLEQSAVGSSGSLAQAANARTRAAQLLADIAAAKAMDAQPDVSVAQLVESRVSAALQAMHYAETLHGGYPKALSTAQVNPLTSLNVTVGQRRQLMTTGSEVLGGGNAQAFVAVTQDKGVHIGSGFAETVAVGVGRMGVEFTSAIAQKIEDSHRAVLKTHIDLRFTQLNVSDCTGALPEIWGVQPMTKETAIMLVPPKTGGKKGRAAIRAAEP